jgi:hypothetical protein
VLRLVGLLLVVGASAGAVPQDTPASSPLVGLVGEYVEEYFARAQSIIARETVVLQPLARDLTPDGFARRLVYDLRLDWNPSPAPGDAPATIVRELVSAAGPPLGPPDQPDCLDPAAVSPEPLTFLLPDRRHRFAFQIKGQARVDGRPAVTIDYAPQAPEPPVVKWTKMCAKVDLPGRMRGRLWVDPGTGAVLRFDEHLVGPVDIPRPPEARNRPGPDWFTFERVDTSIHYEPVTFSDPDETVLLPSRVEGVSVITNSGVPRLRITQSFTDYRRFVTESRIVR